IHTSGPMFQVSGIDEGRARSVDNAIFAKSVMNTTSRLPSPGHGSERPDCVADDAVSCELVSTPNSLLTGKLTGNFAESGHPRRFPHLINELIQRLAAKFPTQRNREFLQP